jgi:hypothetical protein
MKDHQIKEAKRRKASVISWKIKVFEGRLEGSTTSLVKQQKSWKLVSL